MRSASPVESPMVSAVPAFILFASILGAGCATGDLQVRTSRYTVTHPEFWEVAQVGNDMGAPTIIKITPYGNANMDNTPDMRSLSRNDARLADVELRIYAWPAHPSIAQPTQEAGARLMKEDPGLGLRQHTLVPEIPPECNVLPKKFRVFGVDQEPANLIQRGQWRTIVIGGQSEGTLLGVVARVGYDAPRLCENLRNLQVSLQNALDGIRPAAGATAPPAKPPVPATASEMPGATPGDTRSPGPVTPQGEMPLPTATPQSR